MNEVCFSWVFHSKQKDVGSRLNSNCVIHTRKKIAQYANIFQFDQIQSNLHIISTEYCWKITYFNSVSIIDGNYVVVDAIAYYLFCAELKNRQVKRLVKKTGKKAGEKPDIDKTIMKIERKITKIESQSLLTLLF